MLSAGGFLEVEMSAAIAPRGKSEFSSQSSGAPIEGVPGD
jgi:hypothetical protein